MTATAPATVTAHECEPLPGTVYSAGPRRAGLPGDVRNAEHYPLTAACSCGAVIRCERLEQAGWARTGRTAGQ